MHRSLHLPRAVLIDTVEGTQHLGLHANRSRKTGGQEHVNIGVPEVGSGGVHWHEPASNTDKWPILSDTVIYRGVPQGSVDFMI